jgi:D-arabinose 1-dehydrogenase-like Zn-dependent alcohol dehydrogenase
LLSPGLSSGIQIAFCTSGVRLTLSPPHERGRNQSALLARHKEDVRVDTIPDPTLVDPTDVVVKVTSTAIYGSDLCVYDDYMIGMEKGQILGHETMTEVVEK